ncbi:MAG: glycosyltransferase family 39 protein [Nocardioides sp.]
MVPASASHAIGGDAARRAEPPSEVSWPLVLPAVATVVVVLSVFSNGYGFERDELYFMMLKPAWGYVDQPPLTPLLAHALADAYGGGPWLLRVPATLCAAGCVLLTALLARELGGGARAQAWTAWGMATTSAVTVFGHSFLTSTPDLVAWPAVSLAVVRALRRDQPRWWLVAGVFAGLATYNKLLIAVLLAGVALGLALVGPRTPLRSAALWAGAVVALVVAMPNVVYQVVHGWPQLDMGHALAADNASDVRASMWPLMVLLMGPPLAVIWVAGLRALWRDERVRCLTVAFAVVVVFTFVSGTQAYYPLFFLPVPFAAGVVAWAGRLGRVWGGLFALNGVVSVVLGLPVVAVGHLGSTPIPDVDTAVQDSVGWPAYVDQIAAPYDALSDPEHAVVVTSNYGEAGAVARYRPDIPVFSAQNALYDQARPPDGTTTVVFVGGELGTAGRLFDCHVVGRLENGVGVDNEEQGEPVALCSDPVGSWSRIWPQLRHLD